MNQEEMNFSITPTQTLNSTSRSPGSLEFLEVSLYVIHILFGLPTHSFIICLIVAGSGTASDFVILNLSVCEIGNCFSCLFSILKNWFQGLNALSLTLFGLFFTGRPMFQCLLCVELYLAVVHPVMFLKFKPLRYRLMCCSAAWIFCLGICLCCVILDTNFKLVYNVLFSTMFVVFLVIQLYCCLAVLRVLKKSGPGQRGREREEENHMKKRAFYLILITAVSMIIAYLPNALLGFVAKWDVFETLWLTSLTCFVLCGFVQPVLYLNRAGKLNCFCCG